MSIVALKRKTAAKYGNHSAQGGFSLNGATRFVGVGPTNLAKSVTRTPFGGVDPKGHGGGSRCRVSGEKGRSTQCYGSSTPNSIHLSGSNLTPQTGIKVSVKNTAGMFETRFTGLLHSPYTKPLFIESHKRSMQDLVDIRVLQTIYGLNRKPSLDERPCSATGYTKDLNMHAHAASELNKELVARHACLCDDTAV